MKSSSELEAKHFIKADGTVLQTVKLTVQCETHFVKAIECLYFQPTEFVQKGIRIIRFYNCQKFGHLSAKHHLQTL